MPSAQSLASVVRRVPRRWVSIHPSSSAAVKYSPAVANDYSHLLENENEYGIAKPLHMDAFRKENYHDKLSGPIIQASSTMPYINAP